MARHGLNRISVAGVIATFALLATAANGDIIDVRFNEVSPRKTVRISADSGLNFTQTHAGVFNWSRLGGEYPGGGAEGEFDAFCIEISQHISGGSRYTYEVVELEDAPSTGSMGVQRADQLSLLFGQFYEPEFSSTNAAAFQLAVWEIVHDDASNIRAGVFQVSGSGSIISTAQSYLDDLDLNGPRASLRAMINDRHQDHVFLVPAPAALAMFGIGGLLIGRRRRRA